MLWTYDTTGKTTDDVTPASNGDFYNQDAVTAAQKAAAPQADGRTILGDADWLKLLNPVSGLKKVWSPTDMFASLTPAQYAAQRQSIVDQGGDVSFMPATQPITQYKDAQGRTFQQVGTDADGSPLVQYFDKDGGGFRNPTGSDKDHVQATYKLDGSGNAVPVSAKTSYDPSQWVSSGRDAAKILGTVLSAGAAGAALGGGAAAAGGAAEGGATAGGLNFAGNAAGTSLAGAGGGTIASDAGAAAAAAAGGGGGTGLTAAQTAYGALESAGAAAGGGGSLTAAQVAAGMTPSMVAAPAATSLISGISNGQLLQSGLGLAGVAAQVGAANKAGGLAQSALDAQSANAASSAAIAKRQQDLAEQEYADGKARQATFDPLFLQAINASLESQKTADARSAQQWDQYVTNFLPAETKLAQASLNYDTPGRRDEAEAEARAAVGAEAANGRMAQERSLDRAGIKLDSGKSLTLDNASRLQEAKATGAAGQNARKSTELTGLSLLDNTTKIGRGLTSTGLQAAGLGVSAGNAAAGQIGTNQSTDNAAIQPGVSLFNNAQTGLGTSSDIYGRITSAYNQQQQLYQQAASGLGTLAGQLFNKPLGG